MTYKSVLLENLLALCSKFDRKHGDLPPIITATHSGTQRAPKDLMTKAYADDTYAVLLEHLFGELDKLQNPRIVVKRVVLCLL